MPPTAVHFNGKCQPSRHRKTVFRELVTQVPVGVRRTAGRRDW